MGVYYLLYSVYTKVRLGIILSALDESGIVWHDSASDGNLRRMYMARVTVEDCLEKINDRFSLVIVAAKRTKQLARGATPLSRRKENKQVVTALREIAEGKILIQSES